MTLEQVKRLIAIKGHETDAYGQSSYDGDFCRMCGWQGGRNSGSLHTAQTREKAVIDTLLSYGIEVTDG